MYGEKSRQKLVFFYANLVEGASIEVLLGIDRAYFSKDAQNLVEVRVSVSFLAFLVDRTPS